MTTFNILCETMISSARNYELNLENYMQGTLLKLCFHVPPRDLKAEVEGETVSYFAKRWRLLGTRVGLHASAVVLRLEDHGGAILELYTDTPTRGISPEQIRLWAEQELSHPTRRISHLMNYDRVW